MRICSSPTAPNETCHATNSETERRDRVVQLRTLHTQVKVGYFLTRLRELRERAETPAELPPPIEVRCHVPASAADADESKADGSTAKP